MSTMKLCEFQGLPRTWGTGGAGSVEGRITGKRKKMVEELV